MFKIKEQIVIMEGMSTGENAFIKGRFSMEISFAEVKWSLVSKSLSLKEMFNMHGIFFL